MAISRTEAKSFFTFLGINLDNNEVFCFKCSNPLFFSGSNYICLNSHVYTPEQVAFQYGRYLQDLKNEVELKKVCGVQFE